MQRRLASSRYAAQRLCGPARALALTGASPSHWLDGRLVLLLTVVCVRGRNGTDCKEPTFWLDYSDTESIIYMVITTVFIVIAFFTIAVFLARRNHPVVRGSSMYICVVMLLAIIWGLSSVFANVGMPTNAKCSLVVIMQTSGFGLLICCLLVKT